MPHCALTPPFYLWNRTFYFRTGKKWTAPDSYSWTSLNRKMKMAKNPLKTCARIKLGLYMLMFCVQRMRATGVRMPRRNNWMTMKNLMIVVCVFLFVLLLSLYSSRFDTITLRIALVGPRATNFFAQFHQAFSRSFSEQSLFAWNHLRFNWFKISVAGDGNQKHLKCSTARNVTIRVMRKSFSTKRNVDRHIYAERRRNISWKFLCRCIITCHSNNRY